ncbi:hypothetical protein HN51_034076 [Arachis hypogaea]|uniref:uncharacterized protein n=1 Tax=Arachis hypogaea TaxID=3818 RepID=UPI000DECA3FC|nr:ubiquitin fusion degradation protein 1 homolog [Arachis hypogaea]QHN98872.1 uncharacterized protein DS421_13g393130 [Arachis hypogaea]
MDQFGMGDYYIGSDEDEEVYLSHDEEDYYAFKNYYHCHPVSSTEKLNLESGNKIIMPPSALNKLLYAGVEYPMLFEMRHPSNRKFSHCGVLEFTAEEGKICVPSWMMKNMQLEDADLVLLKSTTLVKGTYLKLQPHTKNFMDLSNIKAMLEINLRSFSCVTTGDTIMIPYNNKEYYIDVIETKPSYAISLIETDCEVDFAPPLDYKEEVKKQLPSTSSDRKQQQQQEADDTDILTKIGEFAPFSGSARRLDGKPSTPSDKQASSFSCMAKQQGDDEHKSSDSKSSSNNVSSTTSGKLLFGSRPHKASQKSTNQDKAKITQKPQEPKFQAFTGKKYSLRS